MGMNHTKSFTREVCVLTAVLCLLIALPATAEDWNLVGRHGECAPLASLKRKLPDMPDVRTPDDLAAYLDSKRMAYTRRTHSLGQATAVEFVVPEAGLAVLLAPESSCGRLGQQ